MLPNLLVPSDLQPSICMAISITAPLPKPLPQIHHSPLTSSPHSCSYFNLQSTDLSVLPQSINPLFSSLPSLPTSDYIAHHFDNTLEMTLEALVLCLFIAFIWQNSSPGCTPVSTLPTPRPKHRNATTKFHKAKQFIITQLQTISTLNSQPISPMMLYFTYLS